MSSQAKQKKYKLTKVLGFYQNQADVLAEKSRQLSSQVDDVQRQLDNLHQELAQQQLKFETLTPTPTNGILVQRTLERFDQRKNETLNQLQLARQTFESNRAELVSLMAKIESIEKLIARLTESIAFEFRKQEQVNADERYLNTYFVNR